jgi:hypothetical protein
MHATLLCDTDPREHITTDALVGLNVMMVVSILQELRPRVLDSNYINEIITVVTQLCAQVVYSWKDQWVLSTC